MIARTLRTLSELGPHQVSALFSEERRLPYGYYRDASPDALRAHAEESLLASVRSPGAVCQALDGDPALGLCVYQHLDWDTRTLGLPAGRIAALHLGERTLEDRGEAVAAAGILARGALASARAAVDLPALRTLAAEGFVHDRFHNDPRIPASAADRLHVERVENAVRGRVGFGVGPLVPITVGGRFRCRDVARALPLVSARFLQERGHRFAEVGTQIADLRSTRPDLDVVVVDDCSPDGTRARAREAGVAVLPLPINLGIGGAVQTGFKYAVEHGYDAVLQLDGDGQHDPAEIHKILAPLEAGTADLVIGSRFLKQTSYRAPFTRRVGMILFSALAHRAMGQRVTDTTSGFRSLNREVFTFLARNYPVDFPDAETLVLVKRAGFRVSEVSVEMRPRMSGKSSTTTLKSFYYPFKQLLSIVVVLLRKPPARLR